MLSLAPERTCMGQGKDENEGTGTEEGKAKGESAQKPAGKGKVVLKSDLPLERLVQLNAAALFGSGKVTFRDQSVEVLLDGDGQIAAAFEGIGIMDSKHEQMTGSNRKFIRYGDQKGGEKLLPGLAAIGMDGGKWVSRFPLAGATKVSFDIRIPNLLTRESSLTLRLNWNGKTGYETSFFTSIARVSGDQTLSPRYASDPKLRKPASSWFPRKGEPVKVEFAVEDDKCVVRFDGKELVTYPKVKDAGGKVVFLYQKLVFTIQNLKISGKVDLEWCRERLADLEKKGELKVVESPAPDGEAG
jgi:hypothetical protein